MARNTSKARVVHCKKSDYDVYIGRGEGCKWGNPFSHKKGTKAQFLARSRDDAVRSYGRWIVDQQHLLDSLDELRGKVLGCWCKPKSCHGDILAKLINFQMVDAPRRIAVVGSREYTDLNRVRKAIMSFPEDTLVISGGARGVDSMAVMAAKERGLQKPLVHPAEWDRYGRRRAGYLRNIDIVIDAEFVVAFWDGKSPGTRSTIDIAEKLKRKVYIIGERNV